MLISPLLKLVRIGKGVLRLEVALIISVVSILYTPSLDPTGAQRRSFTALTRTLDSYRIHYSQQLLLLVMRLVLLYLHTTYWWCYRINS